MKTAIIEAAKESARVAIISAIPILIDGLQKGMVDWRLVGVSMIINILRTIDKFMHELGKEENSDFLTKGLTRF